LAGQQTKLDLNDMAVLCVSMMSQNFTITGIDPCPVGSVRLFH